MGGRLDAILVKEVIETVTPVNVDFISENIWIDNREDAFTIQVIYDSGISVNMDLLLEFSSDGINFSTVRTQNITDATGSHIWDVADTGSRYCRVSVIVNSGSINLQRIFYNGRRRH